MIELLGSLVLFVMVLVFYYKADEKLRPRECTTSQLHQVIEKVELCKKQNVICSIDAKDKIIYEVCK